MALQPQIEETTLKITERTDGEIAYVEAAGEIDRGGEKALRRMVEGALSRGARSVIFDLRRVHFMDMGALRILMGAKSHVAGCGGEVYVLVDEDLPKRVIYMARLQSAMKVCHSIDEALADIALRATHAPHLQVPTAPRPGL